MNYTPEQMIEQYVKLRDTKRAISAEFEEKLKPYDEALDAIENALLYIMRDLGVDSIKSNEFGTAYKKKAVSFSVNDRSAWLRFVIGGEHWDMLTNHIAKEALEAFLEQNDNVPPEGVDIREVLKVQVRKAS